MSHLIDLWASVALLCGLGHMGWVFFKQLLLRRSRNWPATNATITRSELPRSSPPSGTRGSARSHHRARIEYNYMVGTRVYRGATICVAGSPGAATGDPAQELVSRYPLGARVPVYYDPSNPEICCLEHCRAFGWPGYLFGGLVALFGLLLLLDVIPTG